MTNHALQKRQGQLIETSLMAVGQSIDTIFGFLRAPPATAS